MMLKIKETKSKDQPGYSLIHLRHICTNLNNGMERSGIGVDLKQEANANRSSLRISLKNVREPLTTPRRKRVMVLSRLFRVSEGVFCENVYSLLNNFTIFLPIILFSVIINIDFLGVLPIRL